MHTKGTVCFIVYLPVTGYTYSASESYYCPKAPGLYREFIDQPSRPYLDVPQLSELANTASGVLVHWLFLDAAPTQKINTQKWLRPVEDDQYKAYCTFYKSKFDISHSGLNGVKIHGKGKKHWELTSALLQEQNPSMSLTNRNVIQSPQQTKTLSIKVHAKEDQPLYKTSILAINQKAAELLEPELHHYYVPKLK
uniref:Uncharacterized protein n=1 Tax=Timema poppense TaxID=170557 RepID=A0A7R9H075_TIMPO|nr:unnamed protein product [Timema poppensis]